MLMIDAAQFSVFLFAAVVLAVTPGPGVAYVIARTAAGGRAEGIASSLGTAAGGCVHVLAAGLGLSALLAQSALAFTAVKIAGACYLVYLGLRILVRGAAASPVSPLAAVGTSRAFFEGVVVETLNVKTALFFLAFIPQFVDPSQPPFGQFIVLGVVCVFLNTAVDLLAVAGALRLLQSPAARGLRTRLLSAGSGLTLVGLGAYVALADAKR
jgi:threonine/homoserine/homoserine lactone efflux protein